MKVNFKRVATAALAVAMSLSLSVSAFAAEPMDNCSLTVEGKGLSGKTVYAIRMFTADVDVPEKGGENTFVNYKLEDNWINFFKSDDMKSELQQAGVTIEPAASDEDVKAAALKYMEWLATEKGKTETDYVAFADDAEAWFYDNAFTVNGEVPNRVATLKAAWNDVVKTATGADGEEGQPDQAVFNIESGNALRSGYYLILPDGGSTGNAGRDSDAILYNIPRDASENNTIKIKSTFPTVDKKVDTNETVDDTHDDATDNGSAQVGDTVTFTLKSAVPDMSDFDTYYFAFIDTLSKGLDLSIAGEAFNKTTDVTVYIYNAEKAEQADDNHKVSTDAFNASYVVDSSKTLKVEFSDLKAVQVNNDKVEAGDTIQVVYKATINEEAVTGQGNAENSVQLEYSNNPSDDGHGTSTPDISKVYTYDIDVNKFATSVPNLAGAEFVLSTNNTAPTEEQIEGQYANYNGLVKLVKLGDNSYRVAKPDDTDKKNSFLTTDSGDINIAGLEAGTYYLHEVKAPDDYNKLKDPVKIVIKIENMETGDATITVDDQTASGDGTTVDVENKKGIELPETGSIGTIGLTALGVVVVVAGLFAFPRKKKTRQD